MYASVNRRGAATPRELAMRAPRRCAPEVLADLLSANPTTPGTVEAGLALLASLEWADLRPELDVMDDPEGPGKQLLLWLLSDAPLPALMSRAAEFTLAWQRECGVEATAGIAVAGDTR